MPILDGSIDRMIMEERAKMAKYLKGQIDLKIEINGRDKRIIEKIKEELGV